MDHFPTVKQPYRPIYIRYLPSICYDNQGFHDFAKRRGWTSEKLESAHADNSPLRRDAAAFLQSWLYFGTLKEVMGIPILMSDFVRHDRHRLWITTKRLPAYLQEWEDSVASGSLIEEEDRLRKAKECLCAVAERVNDLADRQSINRTSVILTAENALALAVLVFTLDTAITKVHRRSDKRVYPGFLFKTDTSFMDLLRSRFSGSCPSLFDRLEKRLHYTGLYYASLLKPPPTSENHRGCTKHDCVVEKVDATTYSTAHSHPECNCAHIYLDWRELIPIVFFNLIPLVSLENGSNGLYLNVVPFENPVKTPYVTISHVWSHGLGNPQANSLPECQLRSLHQRVIESDPQKLRHFWIDTLCVPLEPPEARKRAISNMKDIYRSSKLVLVLDAELASSTHECAVEEVLMRINRSRWLTRLWTFQEAVLARRLAFQFSGGPVRINSFQDTVQRKILSRMPGDSDIVIQAIEFWVCFRQLQDSSIPQAKRFGLLCRDVGWRSTSRIEDESICYASILDLDLRKLLDAAGHYRMQRFWSLQEQIPLALLFQPGQRLQSEGFRWAHSSLLNTRMDDDYEVVIDKEMASIGPQGLAVDCFGYFLSISRELTGNFVRFKHKRKDTWYVIICDDELTLDGWKDAVALSLRSPVLILKNEVDNRKHTNGILAVLRREESDTLFVQYICRVVVIKEGSYVDSLWDNTIARRREGESDAVGDPTEVKRRWCIA